MSSGYRAIVAALVLQLCLTTLACGGAQTVEPRIIEEGSSIVIVDEANESIPIEIRFELDSHVLRTSSHRPLDALAEFLNAREDYQLIEVQGHSDERGTEAYNKSLSMRRAESVIDYLVGNGVDRARLRARGFGSSRPAVEGGDESAFRQNRRVEFLIVEQSG